MRNVGRCYEIVSFCDWRVGYCYRRLGNWDVIVGFNNGIVEY